MKLAIISSNPHDRIGGTETYARNLIDILADKNQITEYPIMLNGEVITKLDKRVKVDNSLVGWKPDDLIWAGTYRAKAIKKIYRENDIVIINNVFPPRKNISNRKTILIQHMDVKFYGFKGKPFWLGVGSFFSWLFFGVLGTVGNPFKKASNVVFFDKSTETPTKSNKYYVPLPSETIKNKDKVDKSGYVWISRLDNPQKNVDDAIWIANNTENFKIFGSGSYKKRLLSKIANHSKYGGSLKPGQVKEVLLKSKALVVTSNWEGFPFIIVEALHAGTPIICYDKFKSLEFFKKSGMVKIANSKEEIAELIKANFSMKQTSFADDELTLNKFKNSWEGIIKEVCNE